MEGKQMLKNSRGTRISHSTFTSFNCLGLRSSDTRIERKEIGPILTLTWLFSSLKFPFWRNRFPVHPQLATDHLAISRRMTKTCK